MTLIDVQDRIGFTLASPTVVIEYVGVNVGDGPALVVRAGGAIVSM